MTTDLRPYAILLEALLTGRLSLEEFQGVLVPLFKQDQYMRPYETYELLNSLFLAAEAYRPGRKTSKGSEVGSDELHAAANEVRRRLRDLD